MSELKQSRCCVADVPGRLDLFGFPISVTVRYSATRLWVTTLATQNDGKTSNCWRNRHALADHPHFTLARGAGTERVAQRRARTGLRRRYCFWTADRLAVKASQSGWRIWYVCNDGGTTDSTWSCVRTTQQQSHTNGLGEFRLFNGVCGSEVRCTESTYQVYPNFGYLCCENFIMRSVMPSVITMTSSPTYPYVGFTT
jgi:hypothetical protein